MCNEMTFGKCLNLLLTVLNIPMSQLAKAINVDNSLVNHWVHERRFPSTLYITGITDFLSKKISNSLQIKVIDELFYRMMTGDKVSDVSNEEKINIILKNSLKYSLACRTDKSAGKSKKEPPIQNSVSLSDDDKLIYSILLLFLPGQYTYIHVLSDCR